MPSNVVYTTGGGRYTVLERYSETEPYEVVAYDLYCGDHYVGSFQVQRFAEDIADLLEENDLVLEPESAETDKPSNDPSPS